MRIEDIDGRRCRLINDDPELKLYVRKNGFIRNIDDSPKVWFEVVWTPFLRNADIFTHEDANLSMAEAEAKYIRESIHI
jgi:hypothetical protein